jgi:hypothetical protein
MQSHQLRCGTEGRRLAVKASPLNGIDYLEVVPPFTIDHPPLLILSCLKPVTGIDERNVLIEGGLRKKDIHVAWALSPNAIGPELLEDHEKAVIDEIKAGSDADHFIAIRPSTDGDFSKYSLRLVRNLDDRDSPPPANFDVILSSINFSFKVTCPSDFDCKEEKACPPEVLAEPVIDYMAKDFASFRSLVLDRLSTIMPKWKERNPADLGIVLVELLAYVGDHLSYYQDSVATEAYLDTARSRISARRIGRLLDYHVNEGCNARALVCFEVEGVIEIPSKTKLLTGGPNELTVVQTREELEKSLQEDAKIFETMHNVQMFSSHNEILFYTWGDTRCCLPKGATRATLKDDTEDGLKIKSGDILIFEEVRSPTPGGRGGQGDDGGGSGGEHDENPSHRHAVRLVDVMQRTDELNGSRLLEVAWGTEDALPFPLCLSEVNDDDDDPDNSPKLVSVARGNVVLVDHGYTIKEPLKDTPALSPRFRPHLSYGPLTFKAPLDHSASIYSAFNYNNNNNNVRDNSIRKAEPDILIEENHGPEKKIWSPVRDLLSSDRFRREFVVEIEVDGTAQLRFGDDRHGMDPRPRNKNNDEQSLDMSATYRIGNGIEGNVGANTITRIVSTGTFDSSLIRGLRNPMPARGGTESEKLSEIRRNIPEAFRTQERAVTESDYAEVLRRHPGIQRASAFIRWTGSWYTVYLTVDRYGGRPVDERFKNELRNFLDKYRLACYDVEINEPLYVPVEISLNVCAAQGYLRDQVRRAVLEAFSNGYLASGQRGFFHPDNFTFGQPVLLSKIYETAMRVDGVVSVVVNKFRRFYRQRDDGLELGLLKMGATEVARLDNDPNFPENGRISVIVEGGR